MELTRGKKAVKASIEVQLLHRKKRTTPRDDARFWCETGLDKEGFRRKFINKGIGFGLFATKDFRKGDFLLEYVGTRLSSKEAGERSKAYARQQQNDSSPRCYMYYFKYKGEDYCIDATKETRGLARYANDACIRDPRCNAKMKLEILKDSPRLCLYALKDIAAGTEIRYDYGEDKKYLFWREQITKSEKQLRSEDSDDDPFDVEADRKKQRLMGTSKENENVRFEKLEVADDPDYEMEDSSASTSDMSNAKLFTARRISIPSEISHDNSTKANDLINELDVADIVYKDYEIKEYSKSESENDLVDEMEVSDTNDPDYELEENSNSTSESDDDQAKDKLHLKAGMPVQHADASSLGSDECIGHLQEDNIPSEKANSQKAGLSGHGTVTNNSVSSLVNRDIQEKVDENQPNKSNTIDGTTSKSKSGCVLSGNLEGEKDSIRSEISRNNSSKDLTCLICSRTFKKKGALTTHSKTHSTNTDKTYKKPTRPCVYCCKPQTQLRRHLIGEHNDEAMVKEALSYPEKSKERHAIFDKIRKQGIHRFNEDQAALPEPKYMSERRGHADVQCSKCHGFYGQRLFYRHREICIGDSTNVPTRVKTQVLKLGSGEFETEILNRFQDTEVGNMCRTDPSLIFIGRSIFSRGKGKVGKEMEVRKSVMQDMRLLARLYICFKEYLPSSTSIEDMFRVKNFDFIERSINDVTKEEGKLKHGVKHALKYLLYSAVDRLIGFHSRREDDDVVKGLQRFLNVLKLHADDIFADSTYAINLNRQEKLRMPEQQAEDRDIENLRIHINNLISDLSSEFTFIDRHEYVNLRDSICSRLTLFNARRGGEPSRLKLSQVHDALSGRWINENDVHQLSDWEKQLFKEMVVAYQAGKGNHLVPVLIPKDCIKGIKILCDPEIRKRVDILESNVSVFPSTSFSPDHIIGWHCISKMCKQANISNAEQLTASKQRHRISTIYSSLEVPENERQYFYKHMGHSKEVNIGTYQYPLPIQEVTKVGRHLQDIDKGLYRGREIERNETITNPNGDDATVGAQAILDRPSTITAVGQPQQPSMTDGMTRIIEDSIKETENSKEETSDGKRPYFCWTPSETAAVQRDFSEWITVRDGNQLPSKKELEDYVRRNNCRFDHKKLRTKIMNEQNTRRRLVKKRMSGMLDCN